MLVWLLVCHAHSLPQTGRVDHLRGLFVRYRTILGDHRRRRTRRVISPANSRPQPSRQSSALDPFNLSLVGSSSRAIFSVSHHAPCPMSASPILAAAFEDVQVGHDQDLLHRRFRAIDAPHIHPQLQRTKSHKRSLRKTALQAAHDLIHIVSSSPSLTMARPSLRTNGVFSLRIRYARVVRFIPSRAAAPPGPPMTQLDARIACRTRARSASSAVLSFEFELGRDDSFSSVNGGRSTLPGDRITARSIKFCNSRTFPGQE